MSTWTFEHLPLASEQDEAKFALLIQRVFRDAFAVDRDEKAWSIQGIVQKLRHSTLLGLVKSANDEIVGYALYSVPLEALFDGKYLLWEDSIGINQTEQGTGLGNTALQKARMFIHDKEIGWIGGRTQNPAVICRYAKYANELFPFTATYLTVSGQAVMSHLLENIHEVRTLDSRINTATGICSKVYPEGRLGDYEIDLNDLQVVEFERKLRNWGFDRANGDAVIVVGKVK